MDYIRKLSSGKSQIIKDIAFCTLLDGQIPDPNQLFTDLIKWLDNEISKYDSSVTKDALNNAHGDWYEWILAIASWNYSIENPSAKFAFLTPNISQFDISRLYKDKLFDLIQDLREKVLESSQVQLISSNPDFVIINRELVESTISDFEKICHIDQDSISRLGSYYSQFASKCDFSDIHGYIAVKTSLRPDRRLQIPHEGSLMKAIYTHIQTREWIISPIGLKYYAIATEVKDADRNALKTVATHSITTVHNIPQAAVDDVFEVNSIKQAEDAFSRILRPDSPIVS